MALLSLKVDVFWDRDRVAARWVELAAAEADAWMREQLERVRRDWPVDTGRSRAAWDGTVRVRGSQPPEILFSNPIGYAPFIHRGGAARDAASAIFGDLQDYADRLARVLARVIEEG